MSDHLVVLVTAPSEGVGRDLARMLLRRRLAACVNIIPSVTSLYTWEGEICVDDEVLLMVKTPQSVLDELTSAVSEDHPYDVPEIIGLPITGGAEEYLRWLDEAVAR